MSHRSFDAYKNIATIGMDTTDSTVLKKIPFDTKSTSPSYCMASMVALVATGVAAYLYEHREDADHHQLVLDLRSLLFGVRKPGF